ncbi:MAG: nucleotidyltransferase domain-containing protein [Puniceicoccales bacterium]|nr:nucleotidyltransferase domain-containing protein [Puniceicoccales bacterium]
MPSPQNAQIHTGTQVVVNAPILGASGLSVHPKGAVGIVTRTPAGTETLYRVRFPDGFEAPFPAECLDVLKAFKERLYGDSTSGGFELETHIIYRCITGSRAYGLDTEASDTDLRGIYVAPSRMHWSLYGAPEQFEDNAAQTCYWEVQKFVVMALKANPNILECLYSPLVEKCTPAAQALLNIREKFLSRMIFQTFNGYALSQFKKLEQDRRNTGELRWKHAMHLIRLLVTGAATLREQRVPVRIESPQLREKLLAVKHGEIPWPEVDTWRRELHNDFEEACTSSSLPERPDYAAANEFLITTRHNQATHQS